MSRERPPRAPTRSEDAVGATSPLGEGRSRKRGPKGDPGWKLEGNPADAMPAPAPLSWRAPPLDQADAQPGDPLHGDEAPPIEPLQGTGGRVASRRRWSARRPAEAELVPERSQRPPGGCSCSQLNAHAPEEGPSPTGAPPGEVPPAANCDRCLRDPCGDSLNMAPLSESSDSGRTFRPRTRGESWGGEPVTEPQQPPCPPAPAPGSTKLLPVSPPAE